LELGRYGEAEAELGEASLLLPASPWPHYNLGWLYQEIGDYEAAVWEYETALMLGPGAAEILDNLLLVYTQLGTEPKRRLELIDQALRADPNPAWQRWLRLQRALLLSVAEREQGSRGADVLPPENASESSTD
jgi:tetratricopeptide (TPR) repeat protein